MEFDADFNDPNSICNRALYRATGNSQKFDRLVLLKLPFLDDPNAVSVYNSATLPDGNYDEICGTGVVVDENGGGHLKVSWDDREKKLSRTSVMFNIILVQPLWAREAITTSWARITRRTLRCILANMRTTAPSRSSPGS